MLDRRLRAVGHSEGMSETTPEDEEAAQRRRDEQVREDARRARAANGGEMIAFVRELGFEELLDDDE